MYTCISRCRFFYSSGLLQEARADCAGATIPAQAAIERGLLAKQTRGAHRRAPRKSQALAIKFLSRVHTRFLPFIPTIQALFPTKTALSLSQTRPLPKPGVKSKQINHSSHHFLSNKGQNKPDHIKWCEPKALMLNFTPNSVKGV